MTHWYWRVIVGVVCAFSHACAAAAPATTETMSTPITLAVKGVAVSDLCTRLERLSGVPLSTGAELADQKVTVLVTTQPLHVLMDGLATLLRAEWAREERPQHTDRYVLRLPHGVITERVDTPSWEPIWMAIDEQLSKLQDRYLRSDTADDERPDPLAYATASWLRTIPVAWRQALVHYQSASIWLDTASDDPAWRVPDTIQPLLPNVGQTIDPTDSSHRIALEIGIMVDRNVAPPTFRITAVLHASRIGTLEAAAVATHIPLISTPMPLPVAVSGPEEPPLPSCVDQVEKLSQQHVSITAKQAREESGMPWIEGIDARVNRSDILMLLHKQTGLQILSDHYSLWPVWNDRVHISARECLNLLTRPEYDARVGWDSQFIYMRTSHPVWRDAREIPSRVLSVVQTERAKRGYLSLDSLMVLAQLSQEQIDTLMTYNRYLRIPLWLTHQEALNQMKRPVLRFLGALTTDQRARLQEGGLPISALDDQQRSLLCTSIPAPQTERSAFDWGAPRIGLRIHGIRIDQPAPLPLAPIMMRLTPHVRRLAWDLPANVAVSPDAHIESPAVNTEGYQLLIQWPDGSQQDLFLPVPTQPFDPKEYIGYL